MPSWRQASRASSTGRMSFSSQSRMLRYCGVIVAGDAGARLGGLHGGADLLDQLAMGAQAVALEVAQDEVKLGLRRGPAHLVEMDEALAAVGGLGSQRDVRQRHDDLGGQVQRVDQLVLRVAGVGRDALNGHGRLVCRERLKDHLALLGAVQRIRRLGLQVARQVGVDAATDLLIGGEGDANRAVGEVGVAQQMVGQRHDDGDSGLVIRAQERGPAGGDDVVADLLGQVGKVRRREDGVGDRRAGRCRRQRTCDGRSA